LLKITLFLGLLALTCTAQEAAMREIIPCAEAHYSFGTAVDAEGFVLFTEFSHRRIQRWNPVTHRLDVWRGTDTPGMFGLATGTGSDVFVGLDLGDTGNPGKILRIANDGKEEFIVENITRPRQLTCDATGNLFAVLEGGRVLKWDKATRIVTEVMTALSPTSGIAVGADGSVFVSEYGVFDISPTGYSRPSAPGQIKVRRPDGQITILNKGFWRLRGIALHGHNLYACSEANREDHGNSGQLVRIDTTNGNEVVLFNRLDYPQFPAASQDGKIHFTLGRDNRLVSYHPTAAYHDAAAPATIATRSSVRGGNITWGSPETGHAFTLKAQSVSLTGNLLPSAGATQMDGWIEIPANRFTLNPHDLYPIHDAEHPGPGLFELPKVEATCGSGQFHVEVFPLRRHEGSRWPMQNVGTAHESPNANFSEQPDAFRFYFSWTAPPISKLDRKPLMIPRPSKPWKDATLLVGDGKMSGDN
jgi:sugar lactone lactonase YvrE